MTKYALEYYYVESDNTKLFTAVLLPEKMGEFPTVIVRTPYVDRYENDSEEDVLNAYLEEYKLWVERDYAVVVQHCRGRGKSDGDCIPYINEREDSLRLQEWIRKQKFYNGTLLLKGESYRTSVQYATAPFADDIKGAVFGVQDSERYNVCYRNGFYKKGLHGLWYLSMYKAKSHIIKNYTADSFNILPLKDLTKMALGECSADFDEMLKAPNPEHEFWNTPLGGSDTKGVTKNVNFPVLFTTGFYDLYTGGIFDMWKKMSEKSRNMSALLVSAYDHTDTYSEECSIAFPNGKRSEKFGAGYEIDWFDFVLGKSAKSPFKTGAITYYNLFKNAWETDEFLNGADYLKIPLGDSAPEYVYNPFDAPVFKGGLSRAFGGTVYQDPPNQRNDIITIYTEPFEKDTQVKGQMTARLMVKSDCEDTCFYIRVSIEKENGDYGLRDDITSLCYQLGDYKPDSIVSLNFEFDEHAFLIKKGERLRIDVSSADNAHYVRHTNQKGLFSEQTTAKIAHNTVYLKDSFLVLPTE